MATQVQNGATGATGTAPDAELVAVATCTSDGCGYEERVSGDSDTSRYCPYCGRDAVHHAEASRPPVAC